MGVVLLLAAVRGELKQLFKSGNDSWGGFGEEDGAAGSAGHGYHVVMDAESDNDEPRHGRSAAVQHQTPALQQPVTAEWQQGHFGGRDGCSSSRLLQDEQQHRGSSSAKQPGPAAAVLLAADSRGAAVESSSRPRSSGSPLRQGRGSGPSSPRP